MSQSPDHPWTCPECRQEVDYYECGKRRDPRSTRFRSVIAQHGPQGADRLAFLMDEDEDLISPRLSELVTMGVLEKGPRTATTKRGNRAHVYQLSGKEVKAA